MPTLTSQWARTSEVCTFHIFCSIVLSLFGAPSRAPPLPSVHVRVSVCVIVCVFVFALKFETAGSLVCLLFCKPAMRVKALHDAP
jgi:hypothetical protein